MRACGRSGILPEFALMLLESPSQILHNTGERLLFLGARLQITYDSHLTRQFVVTDDQGKGSAEAIGVLELRRHPLLPNDSATGTPAALRLDVRRSASRRACCPR